MKLGQLIAFVSRRSREVAVPPGVAPEDVVPAEAAGELRPDAPGSPAGEGTSLADADDPDARSPIRD